MMINCPLAVLNGTNPFPLCLPTTLATSGAAASKDTRTSPTSGNATSPL